MSGISRLWSAGFRDNGVGNYGLRVRPLSFRALGRGWRTKHYERLEG